MDDLLLRIITIFLSGSQFCLISRTDPLDSSVATFMFTYMVFVATNTVMNITYDPDKNHRNIEERGLSFDLVAGVDWTNAIFDEDTRKDYGERRPYVLAMLGNRLHAIIITPRNGAVHVISFRKANRREIANYDRIKEKT